MNNSFPAQGAQLLYTSAPLPPRRSLDDDQQQHMTTTTSTMYPTTFQYSYPDPPPGTAIGAPPPPHSSHGAPHYLQQQHGMPPPDPPSDGGEHHSSVPQSPSGAPRHVPSLQVTYATPTRLRARRAAGAGAQDTPGGGPLDVQIDPAVLNESAGISPSNISPATGPGGPMSAGSSANKMPIRPLPNPNKSVIRPKNADDEEARKARKREMGRERQRRKRLRDKEKREAAKASQPDQMSTMQMLQSRDAGSRASFGSTSSFEGLPSSTSTTYSNLPPMSLTISPGQSYPMSAGSSDASSPAHSMSPMSTPGALSNFSSESWQEHTAVFANMNLSADATIRAKPRATSASLSNVASRRQSQAEPMPLTMDYRPSPNKRRKSDTDEIYNAQQVGLGVMVGPDGQPPWEHNRRLQQRRPVSMHEGIPYAMMNPSPVRSPTPPPVSDLPGDKQSEEFANLAVQALTSNEWASKFQSNFGINSNDLERMRPELVAAYQKWRLEHGMRQVTLDPHSGQTQSPPPALSPGTSTYATPSRGGRSDAPMESPSSASNASSASIPCSVPLTAAAMRLASQGGAPETPHSKPSQGTSSNNASPVNPTLQTPSSQSQGVFAGGGEYGPGSWVNPPPHMSRMYEWRENYSHPLQSPINPGGKDMQGLGGNVPNHGPPLQSPMTVQTGAFVNAPPGSAPRSAMPFSPATPVPQREQGFAGGVPPNVPLYYAPQLQPPLGPGMQGSPTHPLPPQQEGMYLG